ncbi:MAG: DUF2834 domain-containing protein [Pseudomonadota bacterium]
MSPLRLTYLALAILGTVWPMSYFLPWLIAHDFNLALMMTEAWHVNDATTGLVYDLTVAAITLTVFIVAESVARRDYLGLVAIPATFFIGVSCGLPLYLFLRSRTLG